MLTRPLNWRMIDAVVRLEEIEEQKAEGAAESGKSGPAASASTSAAKAIALQKRPRDGE
ncbi:MAG: hypothetical protein ACT4OU_07300 [Hyphomicrobium sp.]